MTSWFYMQAMWPSQDQRRAYLTLRHIPIQKRSSRPLQFRTLMPYQPTFDSQELSLHYVLALQAVFSLDVALENLELFAMKPLLLLVQVQTRQNMLYIAISLTRNWQNR